MKHLRPVTCVKASALSDWYYNFARALNDFWYAFKFGVPGSGTS